MPSEDKSSLSKTSKVETSLSPYQPVDINFWGKMAFWTAPELACLSFGYDPKILLAADFETLVLEPDKHEPLVQRAELIRRAIEYEILPNGFRPIDGLSWLRSIDESVPKDLMRLVERIPSYEKAPVLFAETNTLDEILSSLSEIRDTIARSDPKSNKSGLTKQIGTLRKLLLVVALAKYGLEPDKPRNSTSNAIASDSALAGLSIDADTIRTHLRAAIDEYWEGPLD